jgi:hypothetical protein
MPRFNWNLTTDTRSYYHFEKPTTMKTILLTLCLFTSPALLAQALDPEKLFARDLAAMESLPQLLELADKTLQEEQYARYEQVMKRLTELRPFDPVFRFDLAKAYALQDKKTEAYNDLIELQKAGLSYPAGDHPGFDNIKQTKVFEYIEDGMQQNAQHFGEGTTEFTISHHYSGMLFENLAWDAKGNRFLLGSVRSGAVYQYSETGGFSEYLTAAGPATGPWGVIDLVIDPSADLLWLASATLPHYTGTNQQNFGQAMISKVKLSTGEVLKNMSMASNGQPKLFTAMHLTRSGDLFFINAFDSTFYRIKSGTETVEPVIALPQLSSIKALTSNADETVLYVSDFELGIYVINLETWQVAPLIKANKGFFAGINDLFYDDGDLVAIQSGVQPARLMRYVLKEDLFLQNLFPIEASHPSFKVLGNGVLVDDHVFYAANTQWANTDVLGRLLPDTSWEPLEVIKSPTKYRMEEHMLQQQKMEEIKRKRGLK